MKKVIEVRELSKKYRIGKRAQSSQTLPEAFWKFVSTPFRNARLIRSLTDFGEDSDAVNWALRDLNFEVTEGEIVGVIGRNGAGKSTLLKVLSRITEPSSGEVLLKGRVGALLEVGTGFHPELTGRENIFMNGTILGMRGKEISKKLDEIVEFSGVEKYLDTPVKFYSSGMRVRLGFSVAAHLEPEILIVDEVLSVGDAEFQAKCIGKLGEVANSGRTILFVSHDLGAISKLCSRAILLNHGQLEMDGLPKDVVSKYLQGISRLADNRMQQKASEHPVMIQSVRFVLANGQQVSRLLTGDSFFIEIEYSSDYEETIPPSVCFHLFFKSENGVNLFILSTKYSHLQTNRLSARSTLRVKIKKLPLLAGTYFIDVCVKDGNDTLLYIDQFQKFVVEGGNMDGYQKLPSTSAGPFALEHEWV